MPCYVVGWLATHLVSPRALTSFAPLRKSKIYGLTSSIKPTVIASRAYRAAPAPRVKRNGVKIQRIVDRPDAHHLHLTRCLRTLRARLQSSHLWWPRAKGSGYWLEQRITCQLSMTFYNLNYILLCDLHLDLLN